MSKQPINTSAKTNQGRPGRGVFFKLRPGILRLNSGATFAGMMPDWQTGDCVGEVVFNTGMTGYVESLTDPSYSGQILVFTYPLIGNYGVRLASAESDKIQVRGVVVSEAAAEFSHAGAELSLPEWLQSQNIPLLTGVDTRALTRHLRSRGSMPGAFGVKPAKPPKKLETSFVSIPEPVDYTAPGAKKKVILVDCGAKENIVRELLKLPVNVRRVPAGYDYTNESYDGVFLSNGPGDPEDYVETIAVARKALAGNKPMFGICLGTQIMALAAGAKTYKLKFGHRGHNQPCIETDSNRGFITSQNHGYAIDESTLPKGWRANFRNLNDQSIEGIQHATKPFFSVQFHPEACPGPTDTAWLFERFGKLL